MLSRVRNALSGFWPRRRERQVADPLPDADSSTTSPPADAEEVYAKKRKELYDKIIGDLRAPARVRKSRVSVSSSWRSRRIAATQRFDAANRSVKKINNDPFTQGVESRAHDSGCGHSLVNLFQPHSPDSPRCKERRRRFFEENALPLVDRSDDEEVSDIPGEDDLEEGERVSAAQSAPASPVSHSAASASHASPVVGTSPVVAEASVTPPVAQDTAPASSLPSSPASAAASFLSSSTATAAPAATAVPPNPPLPPTTPVATGTTDRTSSITSPIAALPTISVTPATQAVTAATGPASSVPFTPDNRTADDIDSAPSGTPAASASRRFQWPKRKRSVFEPRDGSVRTQPPKKQKLTPPHRGWLLSPIGEESASAVKAESEARHTELDIESEPETLTPCKSQGLGSFEEYLPGGKGRPYSEPPEERSFLSDPMDLDGDSFSADVAQLNAQRAPQPDDSHPLSTPRRRKSKGMTDAPYTPGYDLIGAPSSDDDMDFDIHHLVSNGERGIACDSFAHEKARRFANALGNTEGMSEAEKELYLRVYMRGFEAVMPEHWKFDFQTLPPLLFCSPDSDREPLLYAAGSPDFHAKRALTNLFSVGGRVRDCSILKTRQETEVKRGLRDYLRWAVRDGKVRYTPDAIPVHTIYCRRRGETTRSAVEKLHRRLVSLGRRYGPDRHPLLIGFAICGPICVVLSYDTDPAKVAKSGELARPMLLCQLDMADRSHDVWNSLSLAIVVGSIRESMANLAAEGAGGFRLRGGEEEVEYEDL